MADFPLIGTQRYESAGADTANSTGTTITASASANTKGSYSQLIASTAFDASMITIIPVSSNSARETFLMDIAIGAAASEVVILENLLIHSGAGNTHGAFYQFPIHIPSGTRLSARVQNRSGSGTVTVLAILASSTFLTGSPLSKVDTYGADTSDSGGTSIDPGATINTKGSYSQITSSTTRPIKVLTFAVGLDANPVPAAYTWLFDIAIGVASSEVVIIPNIAIATDTSTDTPMPPVLNMFQVNIPSGTRIAVRSQCSGNNSTDRLLDACIYGAN